MKTFLRVVVLFVCLTVGLYDGELWLFTYKLQPSLTCHLDVIVLPNIFTRTVFVLSLLG